MKRILILSLFLLPFMIGVRAQNSSQGKEFWISFMHNGYRHYDNNQADWVENTVMISAKRACTGVIRCTGNPSQYVNFSVGANDVTFVSIPEAWAYNEGNEETVDRKAVVLRATDTVSVFISNVAIYSFDASFVLPVESLGAEYFIQSDVQSKTDNINSKLKETSAFLIVAVEDDTEVEITPSVTTLRGHAAGVPFMVSMSAGDTYFVRSNNNTEFRDFSGTTIFSRDGKKIAVFTGNTITRIPGDARNGRDHIFEQTTPVDSWGRRFVLTSSAGRPRDIVKITSSADDNIIYRNGEEFAIIGYGDSYEFDLLGTEGSCYIETTEPSIVFLYHTSWEDPFSPSGSQIGDPSMVWIPPVEQQIEEVTFCTFNSNSPHASIPNHYVNIVVHRLDVSEVFLDGELIGANEFRPVAGSDDFCFVTKGINNGMHHLYCESGLIAHVYGFGAARGYAYCVGSNVLTLKGKLYVNGIWSGAYHDGLYICNGESVRMRVVANYEVEQVDWVFENGQTAQGIGVEQYYPQAGDYLAQAHITGFNTVTLEPVDDTMSIMVHVGEPYLFDTVASDCDSVDFFGQIYHQSTYHEFHGTSIYGCDSSVYLRVNVSGITPHFEIKGNHWPIGGSEFYATESEYAIQLDNPESTVDTVIWQVDCPNWRVIPHGKGETCTLVIYNFLLEPVQLHATVINNCDSIHETFFVQTSYHDVSDNPEMRGFEAFPNPTTGLLTLRLNGLEGCFEVKVYDALGREVDAFPVDAGTMKEMSYRMPTLTEGLYYFVLVGEGKGTSRKVMLQR